MAALINKHTLINNMYKGSKWVSTVNGSDILLQLLKKKIKMLKTSNTTWRNPSVHCCGHVAHVTKHPWLQSGCISWFPQVEELQRLPTLQTIKHQHKEFIAGSKHRLSERKTTALTQDVVPDKSHKISDIQGFNGNKNHTLCTAEQKLFSKIKQ